MVGRVPPWRHAGVAGLVALGALVSATPAQAGDPGLVTYAARQCASYTDVRANLARNDIQESLKDLGADTLYVSGEAISARKEAQGQPKCSPIVGWHFHLGTGYATQAVSGTWGSLSKVTDPYDGTIVTEDSVPLLDQFGDPTGRSLRGAVTVKLTDDQLQRAGQGQSLWLQGGDVDDPVLDKPYPNTYGFAALRCAVDNLNGDNVEYIAFPQGAHHVFCYAYYVVPPPTSGTIIVKKVVDDPTATQTTSFPFTGNISYTVDHTFSLSAKYGQPASETFFRASGAEPWTFTEGVPAGWTLKGIDCVSATGDSTSTSDVSTGSTSVTLGSGDTVTCTYTDSLQPPPVGALLISKRTLGGLGAFPFTVTGPNRGSTTLTTKQEDVPVNSGTLTGTPGSYRIAEQIPKATPAGSWRNTRILCGGRAFKPVGEVTLTISANQGESCQFTNQFTPGGSLRIRKVTLGATGTAGFLTVPLDVKPRVYVQSATTRKEGQAVLATGDSTAHLYLGRYVIAETGRRVTDTGYWTLESVVCDGRPVASTQGRVTIRLTSRDPSADCTFTNRFRKGPAPPTPTPTPTPTPGPPTPDSSDNSSDGPFADLEVTKSVSPARAVVGEHVRYTVVVVNHGPDAANDVALAELRPASLEPLDLHTNRGTCSGDRPAHCVVGTLEPGQRMVVTTTVTARDAGTRTNRVAVSASTVDPNLANNTDAATLRVRGAFGVLPGRAQRAPAVTG